VLDAAETTAMRFRQIGLLSLWLLANMCMAQRAYARAGLAEMPVADQYHFEFIAFASFWTIVLVLYAIPAACYWAFVYERSAGKAPISEDTILIIAASLLPFVVYLGWIAWFYWWCHWGYQNQ
jgi:hypothetical protein